jgi:hypothetical protein
LSFPHDHPEFDDLLRIVAGKRKLSTALVEKDYWVTHTLWALHQLGLEIWFKGGTSLSKGFGLIERFSEDLDLKIEPGTVKALPAVGSWKSEGRKAVVGGGQRPRHSIRGAGHDLLRTRRARRPGAARRLRRQPPTRSPVCPPARHAAREARRAPSPRAEGYDGPRALAEEMLAQRQLAAPPGAADEAFLPDASDRFREIRRAHEAITLIFWGQRVELDEACARIRGWISGRLSRK